MEKILTFVFVFALVLMHAVVFPCVAQLPNLREEVHAVISEEYLMPKETLWLEIRVTYKNEPTPSKVVYMELVDRNGVAMKQDMARLKDGKASAYVTIPENLPSDYYLLRVYTRNSPHFSVENGVFHKIIGVINPKVPPKTQAGSGSSQHYLPKNVSGELTINAETDKTSYAPGEEIRLSIHGRKDAQVTVSVALDPGLPIIPEVNASTLYAASESHTYIPEIFGHVIHGKVYLDHVDTTETFFLSLHDDLDSHLTISKPSLTGDLFFETGAFHHYNFAIVQSETIRERTDFIPESPYWKNVPVSSFELPEMKLSENMHAWLQNRLTASLATVYYQPPLDGQIPRTHDFLVPDNSYLLDDYNRFEDMATVLREYVPGVLVRRSKGITGFRNVNYPAARNFRNNPLLLIDAMPILDSDAFSRFHPKDIRKMDVVNRSFYMDHKEFEGAIALISFENDFGKFELMKSALLIAYTGMQKPKTPVSATEKSRFSPNFNTLLFWGTLTLPDNKYVLTIPTSKLDGEYVIRINSSTGGRTPERQEVRVKVVNNAISDRYR